jgi:serine/threonine protein kinase
VLTPIYSAPEREEGEASRRSHDIYSLSATVLFAMTGIPPQPALPGNSVETAVRKAVADHDLGHDLVGQRRLEQLLTMLLAGLHPDPRGRPATLEPLREAFERWETVFLAEQSALAESQNPGQIMQSLYRSRQRDLED